MAKMSAEEHGKMVAEVMQMAANGNYDAAATLLQNQVFEKVHGGKAPNSFIPDSPSKKTKLPDGGAYLNDVEYGKTYPNSFLDIWYVDDGKPHPTLVYSHGGGYLFGDKLMGDPLAKADAADMAYYGDLIKRGFNVVTINYCFATEYRAPAQIVQYNEMMSFLNANAEELGLDMQNIVLMGGSAGANFSAIYSLALCDSDYAKKLGIIPAVNKEQVKCVVIDEMSLDPEANSKDWIKVLAAAWFGNSDIANCEMSRLLDVASHVKTEFLPAYIIASNIGDLFYISAKKLADKLESINSDYKMFYVSQSESEPLGHGFMGLFKSNKYAKQCYEGMHDFIKKYV